MSDLLKNPLWQREEVGKALPVSPHAVSMSLPCWDQVVAYEEHHPDLVDRLECGYPRFVFNPFVVRLFEACERRFAGPGETAMAFPSWGAANRCATYLREQCGFPARLEDYGSHQVVAVLMPKMAWQQARHFWMHFGEVVSSRRAQATLEQQAPLAAGEGAKWTVRERLAALSGVSAKDVFLYPSGMAALADALRVARLERPGTKTVQLGFPYVDVLKVQRAAGAGVHFLDPPGNLDALSNLLRRETVAAVVCEFPGNPLLQSPDLPRLSDLLREHGVPLVIDDTASTCVNTNLWPYADAVMTSLTKHFSGHGDVMAGALALNDESPFYASHGKRLRSLYEDLLYADDAVVLEANSRDFSQRVRRVNVTAAALCDHLCEHPAVARVYYPKLETPENYVRALRPGGGYGGLISLLLKDAPTRTQAFYDKLRMCKGPTLGNTFSMACAYTLLAHYDNLDWAESVGVSRWLVRISVGLEDLDDLKARIDEALR